MKKTVRSYVLLLSFLLVPGIAAAESSALLLRASQHPDFLRIVLEGDTSIITQARVYQREQYVIISFPGLDISVQSETTEAVFRKIDESTIMFSPGEFRGLKVFTLTHPDRLVVDIYLKQARERPFFAPETPEQRPRRDQVPGIRSIVIDPGHGGYEFGLVKDAYSEKNIVLDIGKRLGQLVSSGNARSFLTRNGDQFISLSERTAIANSKGADAFISIHIGKHRNIVLYMPVVTDHYPPALEPYLYNRGQKEYTAQTAALADALRKAITAAYSEEMVTVKPLPYSILSRVGAAALLIELPSLEETGYSEQQKQEFANVMYKGLYIYEEVRTK